jgi:D-arabinose 1-dehydrogenase-like Zn-dependent alcohol dehydrogenase
MPDRFAEYQRANAPLLETNRLWPLYGAGFEELGRDGRPIDVPMPEYGPDELLVRHDAVGLCFSDIKVIRQGEDHPRIYRNMQAEPVTLGHEVSMTIVGVGEALREQYHIGDRFVIQADVFVDGVGYAYGYEIQGGLSLYGIIDQRILDGDHGNYLIPVQPGTGYAESALTEPWACVIAAYQLLYRTGLKPGGTAWFIGTHGTSKSYALSAGFDENGHPARLLLTNVPSGFAAWLKQQAAALGINVLEAPDLKNPPVTPVDDIVLLGADPDVVETVSPHLADFGIVALVAEEPLSRKVAVDVGRIHYNRWVYVGLQQHAGALDTQARWASLVRRRGWANGPHARPAGHPIG